MIKTFFKNKRIKRSIVNRLLEYYEEKYLFFDEIQYYNTYKEEIRVCKKINIEFLDEWIKHNYPKDKYSRCFVYQLNNGKTCLCRKMHKDIFFFKMKCIDVKTAQFFAETLDSNSKFLVLDLRSNCGGDVAAVRIILDQLLLADDSFEIRDRYTRKKYGTGDNVRTFKKVFIFVDRYTMSSAEIIMMSLFSKLQNVVIIGEKTYQKKYGQYVLVNKKSKIGLSITGFEWYVNGRTVEEFWEHNIRSDKIILLENTSDDDYFKQMYRLIVNAPKQVPFVDTICLK